VHTNCDCVRVNAAGQANIVSVAPEEHDSQSPGDARPAKLSILNKQSQTSSSLYDVYNDIDDPSVGPPSNLQAERPYLHLFYRPYGITNVA